MKQNYLKTKPLNFNVGLQRWYVRELTKLVDDLTTEVFEEIKPLYKEYQYQISLDASISSQARIKLNSLRDLFEKKFKDRGKKFAENMVRKTNRYSQQTFWRMMKEMFKDKTELKKEGGYLLKGSIVTPEKEEVIKALVYENVNLITNLQTHYFEQITGAVMRSIQSGEGVSYVEKELLKYKGMTKRRARNVALDQTRKAYNSINMRNMQDAGVKKFEWIHSGGSQKPRKYHMENYPKGLNHGIFDLDKGAPNEEGKSPSFIYPGQEPYCHCRMAAVIEFDLS